MSDMPEHQQVENIGVNFSSVEQHLRQLGESADSKGQLHIAVERLSQEDKSFLVADSFRHSIGSLGAQSFYQLYIAQLLGLKDTMKETEILRTFYKSLDQKHKQRIIDAAPASINHLHLKEYFTPSDMQNDDDLILAELGKMKSPPGESAKISKLVNYIAKSSQQDSFNSRKTLFNVCAYLKYYDGLDAYEAIPWKQRERISAEGKEIVENAAA